MEAGVFILLFCVAVLFLWARALRRVHHRHPLQVTSAIYALVNLYRRNPWNFRRIRTDLKRRGLRLSEREVMEVVDELIDERLVRVREDPETHTEVVEVIS